VHNFEPNDKINFAFFNYHTMLRPNSIAGFLLQYRKVIIGKVGVAKIIRDRI